jgi:hypothetical protein
MIGVPLALLAFQAGAVHSVAAFEVADATFLAGAVASQAAGGVLGVGLLATSDEHLLCRQVRERGVGRAWLKAAIERDLAGSLRVHGEPASEW